MSALPIVSSPQETARVLRENVRRLEGARPPERGGLLTTGCAALDRLLPAGGLPRGSLVEWLGTEGGGAGTLAMLAARAAGKAIVVLDRQRRFYPPAAAGLGVDLESLIVVQARGEEEELWALDQALRCTGVAAVWGVVEKLDWRWFRRLQLAAESGGGLGCLVRPAAVRGQPSWSDAQLLVQPQPSAGARRWRVEVTRCRGGTAGGEVELEWDEATHVLREASASHVDAQTKEGTLHLAAQLARATSHRRAARA